MQWSFSLNNFGVCVSLQSWRWYLRCCSVVVSSKASHKVEQNCTHTKKPTKCPRFKCHTVSVSFSSCRCSSVVFSSKVGREKKKSLETVLWMAISGCGSPARCCQPALAGGVIYADPGVSLALMRPSRLSWLRVLLSMSCCYKLSSFQAHWGRWHCTCFLRPACLFAAHMGSGSSPLSCGVFFPLPLLQAFPLLVAGRTPLLLLEPLRPGPACLLTVPGRSPLPSLQHSGHPTLFAMCLYCSYCLLLSFSFYPGWRSVCPGGYAVLAQGCLWKYRVPLSSPCPCLPKPSGHRHLCWYLK
jgi:hypothetical protein